MGLLVEKGRWGYGVMSHLQSRRLGAGLLWQEASGLVLSLSHESTGCLLPWTWSR